MRWIDSHCHLDSLEGDVGEALNKAAEADVLGVVTVGTDLATSRTAVGHAEAYDTVWAVVGFHPYEAGSVSADDLEKLEELASHPRVAAIGEIGLDFFRGPISKDQQRDLFRLQLRIAKKLDLPVVLHLRDAFDQAFEVLQQEGPTDRLIFHCFSGDADDARKALSMGGTLSFAGNVSFKNAGFLREAARTAGLSRLLVETDSPYLAPVPHRGKPNSPHLVPLVGQAVADALGRSQGEVADATFSTASELFGLSL